MIIYGLPINYDGDTGNLPVIQAGAYRIIHIKNYDIVPIKLGILMVKAKLMGAQFLILDPNPIRRDYPIFFNVPLAA